MNILASAFPFGYGPTSKMLVIAKQLQCLSANNKVDFIGSDIALIFAKQNSKYYNNIIPFDKITSIESKKYDFAICLMNHYFVIWSYINKIPTIFIDSLFWFWEWSDEKRISAVNDLINKIRSGITYDEALTLSKKFNSHELKYVAYQLASVVMTQDFVEKQNVNEKDLIRSDLNMKRIQVGPIIDTSHITYNPNKKDILISLAGTYSPLNREPQAIAYSDMVLAIIDDFVNNLPCEVNVTMTANPDLVNKIIPKNNRIKLVSLSHDDFLGQLNTSKLLLAPAGVTTIYESIYYNTPIVFLPEQHDGHYKNYLRLTSKDKCDHLFPNLLFNTRLDRETSSDPDLEILNIQKLIKDSLDNRQYIDELKLVLQNLSPILNDKKELKKFSINQKEALGNISGGVFNIKEYIIMEEI